MATKSQAAVLPEEDAVAVERSLNDASKHDGLVGDMAATELIQLQTKLQADAEERATEKLIHDSLYMAAVQDGPAGDEAAVRLFKEQQGLELLPSSSAQPSVATSDVMPASFRAQGPDTRHYLTRTESRVWFLRKAGPSRAADSMPSQSDAEVFCFQQHGTQHFDTFGGLCSYEGRGLAVDAEQWCHAQLLLHTSWSTALAHVLCEHLPTVLTFYEGETRRCVGFWLVALEQPRAFDPSLSTLGASISGGSVMWRRVDDVVRSLRERPATCSIADWLEGAAVLCTLSPPPHRSRRPRAAAVTSSKTSTTAAAAAPPSQAVQATPPSGDARTRVSAVLDFPSTRTDLASAPQQQGSSSEACCYCGSNRNVVQCFSTGFWFCNNGPPALPTCIILHLTATGNSSISLSADSRWSRRVPVSCAATGVTDINNLGAVVVGGDVDIISETACTHNQVFHAAISGGLKLSPWLCPSEIRTDALAAAARACVLRRQEGHRPLPAPLRFSDVGSYVRHFAPLIAREVAHGNNAGRERTKVDVVLSWEFGLQGPVATFDFNVGDRADLRVDEHVNLERFEGVVSAVYDGEPSWTATGVVVKAGVPEVKVAIGDCEGGLSKVDSSFDGPGYRVVPQTLALNGDRQQTALSFFGSDEVTGCSAAVVNAILGRPSPSPPLWLCSVPPPPPSLPPASEAQTAAVLGSLVEPVYRVIGPPGTGKTTTTAHIIWALVHQQQGGVLVCAPSNVACDTLALRVHSLGIKCIRYFAAVREASGSDSLPREVLLESHLESSSALAKYRQLKTRIGELGATLTDTDRKQYLKLRRSESRTALASVPVVLSTCSAAGDTILSGLRFSSVVCDEAGQATEPETLIPTRGVRRLVLVGDDRQLGPVILSRTAEQGGLGVSMFARLALLRSPATMLDVQYRMHPAISAFPSAEFYNGALFDSPSTTQLVRDDVGFPWPRRDQPAMFLHVPSSVGEERGGPRQTSYFNDAEATQVAECVALFLKGGARPDEIGVISMYEAQRTLLITRISAADAEQGSKVAVANVDAFQGQERAFIILSLTRSNNKQSLGHVNNALRVNVALTRAQSGLVVVGDADTVRHSSIWARCLQHLSSRSALVTGDLQNLQRYEPDGLVTSQALDSLTLDKFENAYSVSLQCSVPHHSDGGVGLPLALHPIARLNERRRISRKGGYTRFRADGKHEEPLDLFRVQSLLPRLEDGRAAFERALELFDSADVIGQKLICPQFLTPSIPPTVGRAIVIRQVAHQLLAAVDDREYVRLLLARVFPLAAAVVPDMLWFFESISDNAEELLHTEALLGFGFDLLEQDHLSQMATLFSAQVNTVDVLRAESELVSGFVHRLCAAAEGAFRLLQFFWRGRIVGRMDRSDSIQYWSLVHSVRRDAQHQLRQLISRCRYTSASGVFGLVGHHTYVTGSRAETKPFTFYVSRYGVRVDGVLEIRAKQRVVHYTGAMVLRNDQRVAVLRQHATETGPFKHMHRYRPVRNMLCGWGALECLHYVRDLSGLPVLGPDGQPLRERLMATGETFDREARVVDNNTAWYFLTMAQVMLAEHDDLVLLLLYGNPGAGGEAALQLQLTAVLVDKDIGDASAYFNKLAPKRYGGTRGSVTVKEADLMVPGERASVFNAHPTARVVWGVYSTPPCPPGCLLLEFNGKPDPRATPGNRPPGRTDQGRAGARSQVLSEEVAINQRAFVEHGIMHFTETTSGTPFVPPPGVAVTEFEELSYACRIKGRHKIYAPEGHALYIDKDIRDVGARLAKVVCPGAARPVQPPSRAGGAPSKRCCNGNIACGYNSSYFVYRGSSLANIYGVHADHVTSKGRFNNMVPVRIQKNHQIQMLSHACNIRYKVPFIPKDLAARDHRLGAWQLGLTRLGVSGLLPPLPVMRVVLVCTPQHAAVNAVPGAALRAPPVLVTHKGHLPSIAVPSDGVFTEEVAKAFNAAFDGVRVFAQRLVFVRDFLHAVVPWSQKAMPTVVFHTPSISCNDAHFLEEFPGSTSATNARALYVASVSTVADALAASLSSPDVRLQASALCDEYFTFLDVSSDSTPAVATITSLPPAYPAVPVTEQLLADVVEILDNGVVQMEAALAVPQAVVRRHKHSMAKVASSPAWYPPDSAVLLPSRFRPFAPPDVAVALSGGRELQEAYEKARTELFGAEKPAKYGLGGAKPNQLDLVVSGQHRPAPVCIAAVGMAVFVGGQLLVTARDTVRCCVPHRATLQKLSGSPEETADIRSTLVQLFYDTFGAYQFSGRADEFVDKALEGTSQRMTSEDWLVSSRDASGRFLSYSVPSARIQLRLWRVVLPADTDWTSLACGQHVEDDQSWQLYLPIRFGGAFRPVAVLPDSVAGDFPVVQPPLSSPQPPFNAGQLLLFEPSAFVAHLAALGVHRIGGSIQTLADEPEATVASVAYGVVQDSVWLPPWMPSYNAEARSLYENCCALAYAVQECDNEGEAYALSKELVRLEQTTALQADGMALVVQRHAHLLQCNPRHPMLELYCVGSVVEDIIHGVKTVESRLAWRQYCMVQVGWILCFRHSALPLCVYALVTAVNRHDSFPSAARYHTSALLPHLDVSSMSDAAIDKYFFTMYRSTSATFGEEALRAWFASSRHPGSVVCWTIKVLPSTQALCLSRFGSLAAADTHCAASLSVRLFWLRMYLGVRCTRLALRPFLRRALVAVQRSMALHAGSTLVIQRKVRRWLRSSGKGSGKATETYQHASVLPHGFSSKQQHVMVLLRQRRDGTYAAPGGCRSAEDIDGAATAFRELAEELLNLRGGNASTVSTALLTAARASGTVSGPHGRTAVHEGYALAVKPTKGSGLGDVDALVRNFTPNDECDAAVLVPVQGVSGTELEVRDANGQVLRLRDHLGHTRMVHLKSDVVVKSLQPPDDELQRASSAYDKEQQQFALSQQQAQARAQKKQAQLEAKRQRAREDKRRTAGERHPSTLSKEQQAPVSSDKAVEKDVHAQSAPGERTQQLPPKQASQIFYVSEQDGESVVFVHDRVKNGKCFVPGGHQEATDADARYAAWREGREETGVTVPLSSLCHSWSGSGTDGSSWTLTDFAVHVREPFTSLLHCPETDKHRNGRWVTLGQLAVLGFDQMHDAQLPLRAAAAISVASTNGIVLPLLNATAGRAASVVQRAARRHRQASQRDETKALVTTEEIVADLVGELPSVASLVGNLAAPPLCSRLHISFSEETGGVELTITPTETHSIVYHAIRQQGVDDVSLRGRIDYILNPVAVLQEGAPTHRPSPRSLLGTVDTEVPMEGADGPTVLNLYMKWSTAPPSSSSHTRPAGVRDTAEQRHQWFLSGLREMEDAVPDGACVALPWSSEPRCEQWRPALLEFVRHRPRVKVVTVQTTADARASAIRRRAEDINLQTKQAYASVDDADPKTRRTLQTLIGCLHESCMASIQEEPDGNASISSMAASLVDDANSDREKAIEKLRHEQQAITDEFHKNIKERVESGELSVEDVRAATHTVAGSFNAASARPLALESQRHVMISGLQTNAQYNGLSGVTDGTVERGRLRVYLTQPADRAFVNVRRENLRDLGAVDKPSSSRL